MKKPKNRSVGPAGIMRSSWPMARTLFILNDPPYGTERSYNGLRLAGSLSRREHEEVKVFLLGDAAACARKGQIVPNGGYDIERMLQSLGRHGTDVGVCAACMDARGIGETQLHATTHRSSLDELTAWVQWADRVLVF